MIRELKAVFRNGAFIPQEPCEIPEDTEVRLIVQPSGLQPPQITDPAERAAVLQRMIERMQRSCVPPEAFPISREELHERR